MKKRITAALLAITAALLSVSASAYDITMDTDQGDLDVQTFTETAAPSIDDIAAPSAILIERETGTVLYEKNADERLQPASVTKVMTILLIVEEIESGRLKLTDQITTSAYAASMGGSQIFLKEGETMSCEDMLKSIVVSSANDAAVAMAEHISGSEGAFTELMNKKAKALGMSNTVFTNCTGLLESEQHLTTARDISIMSRELLNHDMIKKYTTIWMDTVRDGQFGLSNTNKLIRYYDGATGLKTGFTSQAGYCLSASAEKDGTEYIAVVMNCETSQDRFDSAKALLNYGFSSFVKVSVLPEGPIPPVKVVMGEKQYIQPVFQEQGKIVVDKNKAQELVKTVEMAESVDAPVSKGQVVGTVTVTDGESTVFKGNIIADEDVRALTGFEIYANLLSYVFCGYAPYGNI